MSEPRPTEWDAPAYDRSSGPQRNWAADVLARVGTPAPDARVLDVGCGTGLVTERLCALVPEGRVLAIDASQAMVDAAAARLGERATVWRADALELEVPAPVDLVVSTATLHWVADHPRLWRRLHAALRPGGRLEAQCGGEGNIAGVRVAIDAAVAEGAPALRDFSPWTFSGADETRAELEAAGFTDVRCWLEERPTVPDDLGDFVRTSILPAHLERLPEAERAAFADAVLARTPATLDYVRLNISAVRAG